MTAGDTLEVSRKRKTRHKDYEKIKELREIQQFFWMYTKPNIKIVFDRATLIRLFRGAKNERSYEY